MDPSHPAALPAPRAVTGRPSVLPAGLWAPRGALSALFASTFAAGILQMTPLFSPCDCVFQLCLYLCGLRKS